VGRASVRAAVQAYLDPNFSHITNLGQVFAHPPKVTPEGEFVQGSDPGHSTGAVIYIHLVQQSEQNVTIGPVGSAFKNRIFHVGLVCVLRYKGTDSQVAGAANDAFLDSLVDWIEADRTANSSGAIFQWGEGDRSGQFDIDIKAGMPKTIRQQTSQVFSTVDIMALELFQD
jgi:hypothetical protein